MFVVIFCTVRAATESVAVPYQPVNYESKDGDSGDSKVVKAHGLLSFFLTWQLPPMGGDRTIIVFAVLLILHSSRIPVNSSPEIRFFLEGLVNYLIIKS